MLFGGQEISVAPYTVTRDVNGKITAVTVNPRGIDGTLPVEVTEGLTVAQGVSGTITFGGMADPTNAFDTLIRLRDALNANNGANVGVEIDNLTAAHDRATTASILVGTRQALLDTLEQRLQDDALGLATTLSSIEDADMAKAITRSEPDPDALRGRSRVRGPPAAAVARRLPPIGRAASVRAPSTLPPSECARQSVPLRTCRMIRATDTFCS